MSDLSRDIERAIGAFIICILVIFVLWRHNVSEKWAGRAFECMDQLKKYEFDFIP